MADALTDRDLSLVWIWVIEYLASFPEIDSSILHELIEAAPELNSELGKNAREMVALRCLEDLFGSRNGVLGEGHSMVDSKVAFDLSESCEEVLQSILQETSVSELRMGGPKLLKWDIHPFILHKRASVPKCALEQLKDAILDDTHPYSTFLKQHSGLVPGNQKHHQISEDGSNCNALAPRIDGTTTNASNMAPEGNSSLPLPGNENGVVGDGSRYGNLLQLKRDRSHLADEILIGDNHENRDCMDDGNNLNSNAKRLKQDASYIVQWMDHVLMPPCDKQFVEDSPERMVEGIGKEDCNAEIEPQLGGSGQNKPLESDRNECIIRSRDAEDELQNRCGTALNANKMKEDSFGDATRQHISVNEADDVEARTSNDASSLRSQLEVCIDGAKDDSNRGHQRNPANDTSSNGFHKKLNVQGADDEDHLSEQETSSDSDECVHERVDVDMKKSHFLSSQYALSNDPSTAYDWTEQNLCVKCNEGGQLLVCNFAGCPLMVHKNCLGTTASIDGTGNFYCPFCSYSRAISEYLEAKKKASLARKELSAFIQKGSDHRLREHTEGLNNKEHINLRHSKNKDLHQTHENDNLGDREHNQIIDNGGEVNGHQFQKTKGEKQQLEVLASNDASLLARDGPGSTSTEMEKEEIAQGCQQVQIYADNRVDDENLLCKSKETVGVSQRRGRERVQKEVVEQHIIDSGEKPGGLYHQNGGRDTMDNENSKSVISNYSIRIRKGDAQYTYPPIPRLRRMKLPWTAEEEEILKEGVQRFSSDHDRSIPWKKILEHGSLIFQNGRTPIDLKDKWRNMCKGSPKPK